MEDNKSLTGSQNRQILPVQFVDDIKQIVEYGLHEAYDGANSILVKTYWNVGRRIVEEEQSGKERAEYGIHLIDLLSHELSLIYPKGYSPRNLRDYRLFYLSFKDLEIWHSRVPNLTWTHYRTLLSVTSDDARYWYVHEASQQSVCYFVLKPVKILRNILFFMTANNCLQANILLICPKRRNLTERLNVRKKFSICSIVKIERMIRLLK